MTQKLPVIDTIEIKPQWLDYNEHLNVASYVLIFDNGGETLFKSLGLGEEITKKTGMSWAVLENHITYDNEITLGQTVEIGTQLLDFDSKRIHLYWEMYVAGDNGYLASTLEQMIICIDLNIRRAANFPPDVKDKISLLFEKQSGLKRPENIGRKIGIRR